MRTLTRRGSIEGAAIALAFVLVAGCADNNAAAPAPDETGGASGAPVGNGCLPEIPDACSEDVRIPFVRFALAPTDGVTTARLYTPESGALCMGGTLAAAGPAYENWGGILVLIVDRRDVNETRVLESFDARALGVVALEFTIDSPPPTGVLVLASMHTGTECETPLECTLDGDYVLARPNRSALVVLTESGTTHAPFADFAGTERVEPLDTSKLSSFAFGVRPSDTEVDYDFCVRDVRFLDADGNHVLPPDG